MTRDNVTYLDKNKETAINTLKEILAQVESEEITDIVVAAVTKEGKVVSAIYPQLRLVTLIGAVDLCNQILRDMTLDSIVSFSNELTSPEDDNDHDEE